MEGGVRYDSEVVINGDSTIGSEGDIGSVEVQPLDTRFATCGHQDNISINIGERLYCGLHLEGDTTLLKMFAQALGDVAVEGRKTLLEVFNNHDF